MMIKIKIIYFTINFVNEIEGEKMNAKLLAGFTVTFFIGLISCSNPAYDNPFDVNGQEFVPQDTTTQDTSTGGIDPIHKNWLDDMNWYTSEYNNSDVDIDSTYKFVGNPQNIISVIKSENSSYWCLRQSKKSSIELGDFDSIVVTYSSNRNIAIGCGDSDGLWGFIGPSLTQSSLQNRTILRQDDFTHSWGSSSQLTSSNDIYFKVESIELNDIIEFNIDSLMVYRSEN